MHYFWRAVTVCALVAGASCSKSVPDASTSSGGGTTDPGNAGDKIPLPIEVLGVDGTVREIALTLSEQTVAQARNVALRLHNVRYPTKASVQINDGAWRAITNETVDVSEPARSWGGIGGGFAVLNVTFDVASQALKAGQNTFRFRFEKTNGLSMGYRVLAVDLLDQGGGKLLPSDMFTEDDPSTWSAPSGGDASAGATLWRTATLQEGPLSPGELRAHCSDCHAEDGRDLKYFNFSNFSITERAKFHGLSGQQGKDIAAYIRGLDVTAPGRPWNPPFQPGPGNTDRPVEAFSAGAGIDAVVDEDTTIAAIFKMGFDRAALVDGTTLRRISVNDIPIGLQLPDWNHWLPEIHPKDSIGEAFDTSSTHLGLKALRERLVSKKGAEMTAYLSNTGDSPFLFPGGGARSDFNGLRNLLWESRAAILGISSGDEYKGEWDDALAKKVYASAVWGQVKTWELMNTFGLESYAAAAYPAGEKRAWFSERHLFDTSPFLLGIRGGPPCPSSEPCGLVWTGSSMGNTERNYDYLSNSWYHMQLALNAGQRQCGGHRCVDFGYAYGFLNHIFKTGLYEGGRRLLWGLKAMEERDTGLGPIFYEGFSFATANPFRPLQLEDPEATAWWSDSAHPDRSKALLVSGQVFAEKLGSWTVEAWQDAGYGKSEDGANFMDATRIIGDGSPETCSRSLGDGHWKSLPTLRAAQVHPAVINALARFGLAMWPLNDWMAQGVPPTGAAPGAPTVSASNGSVLVKWSTGATSYNVYRATSANGPWLSLALLRGGSSIADVPPQSGVTYYYAVSANGVASESPLSSASSVAF